MIDYPPIEIVYTSSYNVGEHGCRYALEHIDVRNNVVQYLCELWILGGCSHLEEVVFESGGYTNPVCKESGYHSTLLSIVPRLLSLDGSSCMGHAPLFNTDVSSRIPSLWAIHHSYPGHQNHINLGPKIPQPPLEDQNFLCSLYPMPTMFHHDDDIEGIRRSLHDGGQLDSWQKVNQKSHSLQKPHDLYDHQMQSMATQEHEFPNSDYARPEMNSHHIVKLKNFQQGTRRSVHANAENLIVNAFVDDCDVSSGQESSEFVFRGPGIPVLDFKAQHPQAPIFKDKGNGLLQGIWSKPKDNEELDNSFLGAAGTNGASRIVQFVGQQSKPALVMCSPIAILRIQWPLLYLIVNALKSFSCHCYLFPIVSIYQDKKTHATRELATQTEPMSGPILDQLYQEVCCPFLLFSLYQHYAVLNILCRLKLLLSAC
jgi:hypothetical protein